MVIRGTVVKGKGEGRAIGYPTANLAYDASAPPDSGVWFCRCLVGLRPVRGLAVVGMWTLGNGLPSVEVHLLDFTGDLYGKELDVSLVSKLRDLEKFSENASLVARIKEDEEEAREEFRNDEPGARSQGK